jgi:hypothetical protein
VSSDAPYVIGLFTTETASLQLKNSTETQISTDISGNVFVEMNIIFFEFLRANNIFIYF